MKIITIIFILILQSGCAGMYGSETRQIVGQEYFEFKNVFTYKSDLDKYGDSERKESKYAIRYELAKTGEYFGDCDSFPTRMDDVLDKYEIPHRKIFCTVHYTIGSAGHSELLVEDDDKQWLVSQWGVRRLYYDYEMECDLSVRSGKMYRKQFYPENDS